MYVFKFPYLLSGQSTNWRIFISQKFSHRAERSDPIPGFRPRGSTSGGGLKNSSPWRPVGFDFRSYIWLGETEIYSQKVHTRDLSMYWDHNKSSDFIGPGSALPIGLRMSPWRGEGCWKLSVANKHEGPTWPLAGGRHFESPAQRPGPNQQLVSSKFWNTSGPNGPTGQNTTPVTSSYQRLPKTQNYL